MKYLALYRKYRPLTFNEVSGQHVIIQTLKNAIQNNKLNHSYLFIGPRGTGKTSIAKIFAKSINCLNQKDGCSCEKCDICISSNEENIDIIEMDAASNNGIDEIREIKDHVTLLPTKSKYKIYIIDEVHMLTIGAFNALLKTLEEPPEHVIFILATTEPHKIPLTIKSRCQSFEFKPIPSKIMFDRLKFICDEEKIKYEEDALNLIVQNANGGLRDAISLLDQVSAYSNSNITKEDVVLLNGRIIDSDIEKLFDNILNQNYNDCFEMIDNIEILGKEFTYICEDIIKYLKNSLLDEQINKNNKFINQLGKDKIIEIIKIFNDCINEMKLTNDKRIYFDLAIIKIFNIYSTNVCVNKENEIIKDKTTKQVKEKKEEIEEEKIDEKDNKNYYLYEKLMNIRMNNILLSAKKDILNKYNDIKNNLERDINNLDDLKIINILNDCKIVAGSELGLIIVVDNENILYELYDNYEQIENIFNKKLNKKIFCCTLLEEVWKEKRLIYVDKIKNKEKIEKIDESDIIEEIQKQKLSQKDDFEDLLEIGE